MASLTRWTWLWVNSGSWWWTRRPGVLWFMGSQTVGYDRVTELKRTELNSAILVHLSLLIPRISMFSLVISFLTTFNLPGFMDLTFQVPMQYCSFQHWTLLPLPVTSKTGCFCLGFIHSFFLELFLHWSLVAYWAPTNLGSSSFSVLSLLGLAQ